MWSVTVYGITVNTQISCIDESTVTKQRHSYITTWSPV